MNRKVKCTVVNQEDSRCYIDIPNDGDWYVVQVLRKINVERRTKRTSRFASTERNEATPPYTPKTDWRTGTGRSSYRAR